MTTSREGGEDPRHESGARPAADAGTPKKKGKGKLLIILVATLVLALGGGGAAYFFMGAATRQGQAAKQKGEGHEDGEHGGGEEADEEPRRTSPRSSRCRRSRSTSPTRTRRATCATTVSLVIKDTEKAATLSGGGEHKAAGEPVRIAMARSAILELLTTKTAEELMTAEGKTALKKEIAARASKAFRFKVNDVLLAEFVVQ